jgi:hypothetical protein
MRKTLHKIEENEDLLFNGGAEERDSRCKLGRPPYSRRLPIPTGDFLVLETACLQSPQIELRGVQLGLAGESSIAIDLKADTVKPV